MKPLIAMLSISIILLCWGVDLSAQEKEDNKRLEITGYFGAGGGGSLDRPFNVKTHYVGVGLEYFLTPRVSIEGEINYLPHIGWPDCFPWGMYYDMTIMEGDKYRLLWDVNFLFYFDLTRIKRPTMRWFLAVGTGFQYDQVEYIVVSHTALEQYKYTCGEFSFQKTNFGIGYKVNIKGDWALKLLFKIHMPYVDSITSRLALGLSYRF